MASDGLRRAANRPLGKASKAVSESMTPETASGSTHAFVHSGSPRSTSAA
jgi:hypothetical protein